MKVKIIKEEMLKALEQYNFRLDVSKNGYKWVGPDFIELEAEPVDKTCAACTINEGYFHSCGKEEKKLKYCNFAEHWGTPVPTEIQMNYTYGIQKMNLTGHPIAPPAPKEKLKYVAFNREIREKLYWTPETVKFLENTLNDIIEHINTKLQ